MGINENRDTLKDLQVDRARFIALLAKSARTQRHAFLGNVAEDDLGGVTPLRGDYNPTAEHGARSRFRQTSPGQMRLCARQSAPCPNQRAANTMR
jgi:hypothetical protein